MPANSYILMIDQSTFRIGFVDEQGGKWVDIAPLPETPTPDEIAHAVTQWLSTQEYNGQSTALVVNSMTCLCATISTEGLRRNNARQAMVYRLEEKLPIASEDLVADFITHQDHALGICTEHAPINEIVQALESHGIPIEAIIPTGLLAIQSQSDFVTQNNIDTVIWANESTVELFFLADGKPIGWHILSNPQQDIPTHLAIYASHSPQSSMRIATYNCSDQLCSQLKSSPNIEFVENIDKHIDAASVEMGSEILTGNANAVINLRRDQLAAPGIHRRIQAPLVATVAATILVLLSICGSILFRAGEYQQIAENLEQQQMQLYKKAYPSVSVPLNIKSRLTSERRRMASLRGSGDSSLSQVLSTVPMFHDVLAALPKNLQYRVSEMRFNKHGIYLEGQALSHSDADAISSSLAKLGGLVLEPPRTEQLTNKNIAFTIRGATTQLHTDSQRKTP